MQYEKGRGRTHAEKDDEQLLFCLTSTEIQLRGKQMGFFHWHSRPRRVESNRATQFAFTVSTPANLCRPLIFPTNTMVWQELTLNYEETREDFKSLLCVQLSVLLLVLNEFLWFEVYLSALLICIPLQCSRVTFTNLAASE